MVFYCTQVQKTPFFICYLDFTTDFYYDFEEQSDDPSLNCLL